MHVKGVKIGQQNRSYSMQTVALDQCAAHFVFYYIRLVLFQTLDTQDVLNTQWNLVIKSER